MTTYVYCKKKLSGTTLSPKQSVWLFFTRAKFCPTRGGTLNNLKEKGNNVNTRIPFSKKSYQITFRHTYMFFIFWPIYHKKTRKE